ncbi:TetR family transcriptional regulator, partial [Streptomyces sp. NPDC005047]
MNISQQRADARPRARGTERSLARRAELIAIGRRLFA